MQLIIKTLKLLVVAWVFVILGFITFLSFYPLPVKRFISTNELREAGYILKFASLELDFATGFRLVARDLTLTLADGTRVTELEKAIVLLSTRMLLKGRIIPSAITVDGLRIVSELTDDGIVVAGKHLGGKTLSSSGQNSPFCLVTTLNDFHNEHGGIGQTVLTLQNFRIENSELRLVDTINQQEWQADQLEINFNHSSKDKLQLQIALTAKHHHDAATILISASHLEGAQSIEFSAQLNTTGLQILDGYLPKSVSSALNSDLKIEAATALLVGKNWRPLVVRTYLEKGSLNLPTIFSTSPSFEAINITTEYDFINGDVLTLPILSFVDSTGWSISASARLSLLEDAPFLNITIMPEKTSVDHLAKYLPDILVPELSSWLSNNLNQAEVFNAKIDLNFPIRPGVTNDQNSDTNLAVAFDFENLNVNFWDKLAPGQKLSGGHFKMDRNQIEVTAAGGFISKQAVSNLNVVIGNLFKQTAPVSLRVSGDVAGDAFDAVETFVNPFTSKPLPVKISGVHQTKVELALPIKEELKNGELLFLINGQIRDLTANINDQPLSFSSRLTEIEVTESAYKLKSRGQLNSQPVDVELTDQLVSPGEKTKLKLKGELSDRFYADYLPSNYLHAVGPARILLDVTKTTAESWGIDANLQLEQTKLELPDLDWRKGKGVPLTGRADGIFHQSLNKLEVKSFTLLGPNLNAVGSATIPLQNPNNFELNLSKLLIGKSNLALKLTESKLNLNGTYLDLSSLRIGEKRGTENGLPDLELFAALNQLELPSGRLQDLNLSLLWANSIWKKLNSRITLPNSKSARVYLDESKGYPVFRLQSNNAGDLLEAFGVNAEMNGGTIDAELQAIPGHALSIKNAQGSVNISNVRVTSSPLLFQLLSYFSLTEYLSPGKGAVFNRISGSYVVRAPILDLSDVQLESSLLTIFINGTINLDTSELNLKGKAVPLTQVGKITRLVPIIGKTVSGLQKSILGVGFSITGPQDKSKISFFELPF